MAYTEFFVTKGASVANTNGGGPQLGANDGPIYALAAGATGATATNNGADSNIEDLNNGGWAGVVVDDYLCFDTAGLKEFAKVTAIAVGGDADIITVHPQVTAAVQKACNVGGAWQTVDFAASNVGTTDLAHWQNAAGNPPRVNIKYSASHYDEGVTSDNSGTAAVPIRFEGYKTTAGDLSSDRPTIDGTGAGTSGVWNSSGILYVALCNLNLLTTTNNMHGIYVVAGSSYWQFEHLVITSSGTGGFGYYGSGDSVFFNCQVAASGNIGFYAAGESWFFDCVSNNAGGSGFEGGPNIYVACIADSPAGDGFLMATGGQMINCVGYGSTGGSGVRIDSHNGTELIANCIFESNNQYGIEADTNWTGWEDYNALYLNAVAARLNVQRSGASDVALTGSAFTNGAGGDFSLNNTAGAGADCRDAGFAGTLIDGTNIGHIDIGALQHDDPVGGAGGGSHILGGFIVR